MNSYFNQEDFNPGGKYGPDAEAMQDLIDQASPFNVANSYFPGSSSGSRQNDGWGRIVEAVTRAGDWRNKYRDTYGDLATQPYRNPIQFQSNPNVAQIGESILYTPPQQPFTTTGGKSSGASTAQKLGQIALTVAPFTGPAAPFVAGVGAITKAFG